MYYLFMKVLKIHKIRTGDNVMLLFIKQIKLENQLRIVVKSFLDRQIICVYLKLT